MKRLNEKDFELIKTLINAGVRSPEIVRITGRSRYSVGMIKKADDFKNYQKNVYDHYVERKLKNLHSVEVSQTEESASIDREAENSGTEKTYDEKTLDNGVAMIMGIPKMIEEVSKRLDHIEIMLNEHIESHQAELTLLKSKKIIW